MLRWLIWAAMLILTSGSSTLASRARNTPSLGYHMAASFASHGTFFLAQIIGIDVLIEVIRTRSVLLALTGFGVYACASTFGSVLSHWIAMRFFETGDRRVGGYKERV